LIHSAVDFNLQIPAYAATFMVLLALGWTVSHLPRQSEETPWPPAEQRAVRWRMFPWLALGMAGLAVLAVLAARLGLAHFYYQEARAHAPAGAPLTEAQWQTSRDAATRALQFNSRAPEVYEYLGMLHTLRPRMEDYRQAAAYFRQALAPRPVSLTAWAGLALAKAGLQEFDAEFEQALRQAASAPRWLAYARQAVMRTGLEAWFKLSAESKAVVVNTLEEGLLAASKKSRKAGPVERILRHSRHRLALCRYQPLPERLQAFCAVPAP
jgi:tetratricopeptide (TPR) repeat protein